MRLHNLIQLENLGRNFQRALDHPPCKISNRRLHKSYFVPTIHRQSHARWDPHIRIELLNLPRPTRDARHTAQPPHIQRLHGVFHRRDAHQLEDLRVLLRMPPVDLCSNIAVFNVDFVCAVVQQGLCAAFVAGRGAYECAFAFGESCGCETDA